ncbi:olefin beta-lactone synthetase [Psychromonas sp. PT13]|uniref:olefin beta-lactone synthetase n=1 Tax=Psychromonas sp. PT13 TaxID=3439547 RepID=UPI003EBC1024
MHHSKQSNLCHHLADAAEKMPQSLAVALQKRKFKKLTYSEINFHDLHQYSDRIAYALNQYGLQRGDKAVLMVTPSIDFFALTFALFKAGIIPILVDPGMGIKNLKQCFEEAQPDAFIAIPKAHFARVLFAWGKETVKQTITVGGFSLLKTNLAQILKKFPNSAPYPMVELESNEMAAILFTSGSTGTPKGVVYSHAMFEAQINILKSDYQIEPGERDLATFPLFSLFGPALGMASIVPDMDASKPINANPANIFAAIEKYQCTNLFANPALMDVLGKAAVAESLKLKSLKRVISAGAPATLPVIKAFTKLLNRDVMIQTSYGATESLPLSKINSEKLLQTEENTENGCGICVGTPVSNTEISVIEITEKIIPTWDDSLKLANNQIGELVVKGAQVSTSYYERISATEQAKIKDADNIRHRMGDLGYIDDIGQIWMCGRKSHRVESHFNDEDKSYYTIPCERIFNTHSEVKRSALVAVRNGTHIEPLLCIELQNKKLKSTTKLFTELHLIAQRHEQTAGIKRFLIHPQFPVDVRHNAKIFREKLAIWAQHQLDKPMEKWL